MESRTPYQTAHQAEASVDLAPVVAWLLANVAPFLADPHRKVQAELHFAGGKFGGGAIALRDVRAGESVLDGVQT